MKSIKTKIIDDIKIEESKKNIKENEINSSTQFMRKFWKDIEANYFPENSIQSLNKIIHLISSYSQHDPIKDYDYKNSGFPKSFSQFISKHSDAFYNEKNNPLHIVKLFGINIYIDHNSQLQHRNSKREDISEEIHVLSDTLIKLENLNSRAISKLKEKLSEQENNQEPKKYLNIDERYHILIDQIISLQMKQLSESVQRVQYDKENKVYEVSFDIHEKIPSPQLFSTQDYFLLMSNRDFLNNICIYDLFQEKIHSYYTQNSDDYNNSNIQKPSNYCSPDKPENYSIATNIHIDDYAYCHHCKQRKPLEVMLQCKSGSLKGFKSQRPIRRVVINGTAYIYRNKSLIVKNYTSGSEEFLEAIHDDDDKYFCSRYFCHFCLKGSYDAVIEEVKDQKDWVCPYCTGQCFCSRCTRNEKILKLLAYYISIGGNIDYLYDDLVIKSKICDKLNQYLVITNVIVVINDKVHSPKELINQLYEKDNNINNNNHHHIVKEEKIDTLQHSNYSNCDSFAQEDYQKVCNNAELTKKILERLDIDFEKIFSKYVEDKNNNIINHQNYKNNNINEDNNKKDKFDFLNIKRLRNTLKFLDKMSKGKEINDTQLNELIINEDDNEKENDPNENFYNNNSNKKKYKLCLKKKMLAKKIKKYKKRKISSYKKLKTEN